MLFLTTICGVIYLSLASRMRVQRASKRVDWLPWHAERAGVILPGHAERAGLVWAWHEARSRQGWQGRLGAVMTDA